MTSLFDNVDIIESCNFRIPSETTLQHSISIENAKYIAGDDF